MGKIQTAECQCGFKKMIKTGGNMHDFKVRSYFPFNCKKCGLVDVNIMQKPLACPICKSIEVNEYGKYPNSIESKEFPKVQCFNYGAPESGNFCPMCKKMTLAFNSGELLFD